MKRVVIADDSATARIFIQRCLEIAGLSDAEFVQAANGREALELLRTGRPDLLVTDLTMPDMDGTELLTRICASPTLNGLPVMVVSSQTNPKVVEELKSLGAGAILSKPVNPGMVADALEDILGDEL